MSKWTDPSWLATAHAWIHDQVDGRVEAIEQPHVRPWSTVLRARTPAGDLWFKASIPVHAHEAAIVSLLARERPGSVPPLLAVDLARGWMLMGDGGARLRDVIERERDLSRWLAVLPDYGRLQLAVAGHADELVARGAPDRRLATLAAQYERLVGEVGASPRLRALVPLVAELCDELGALGVPETVQHDDFHDGQIFVRDDRYLSIDWAEACVSHPFFSMSVALEGGIAWGLDDVDGSEDIGPYRDAYLSAFHAFGDPAELEAAHATALRLGWICRALNVHAFASALDPPDREELLAGVGVRLGLFADRLPRRRGVG